MLNFWIFMFWNKNEHHFLIKYLIFYVIHAIWMYSSRNMWNLVQMDKIFNPYDTWKLHISKIFSCVNPFWVTYLKCTLGYLGMGHV